MISKLSGYFNHAKLEIIQIVKVQTVIINSSKPKARHEGICAERRKEKKVYLWSMEHTLKQKGILFGKKEPGSSPSNGFTDLCHLISVLPSFVAGVKLGSGEPCSGVLSISTSPSCLRLIPRSVEPCRIGDPGMLMSASFEKSKPSGIQHIIF